MFIKEKKNETIKKKRLEAVRDMCCSREGEEKKSNDRADPQSDSNVNKGPIKLLVTE